MNNFKKGFVDGIIFELTEKSVIGEWKIKFMTDVNSKLIYL